MGWHPFCQKKKIWESLFGLCGLVGPKGGSKEKITIRGFLEDLAASFAPCGFGAAMEKCGSWGVRMPAKMWSNGIPCSALQP